jgi:hypothetical protein
VREVLYTMTFQGSGAPDAANPAVLNVASTGKKLHGGEGLADSATFKSVVTVGADGTFKESGTIAFGNGTLRFSEAGPGTMAPRADGRQAGGIVWRVDGGDGALAGASGYITSNFSVGADGGVSDHHLGVLCLP